jgi:hypothetical protein
LMKMASMLGGEGAVDGERKKKTNKDYVFK